MESKCSQKFRRHSKQLSRSKKVVRTAIVKKMPFKDYDFRFLKLQNTGHSVVEHPLRFRKLGRAWCGGAQETEPRVTNCDSQ